MDERQIIPIEDERAASVQAEQAERYREFLRQWEIDELPACDVGMKLLFEFAEAQPQAYEMTRKLAFTDIAHPKIKQLVKWKAFAEHCTSCGKCNEV